MFKHSRYIKNNEEVLQYLKSIGYILDYESSNPILILTDHIDGIFWTINQSNVGSGYTNCLGNLPLFKALTAVRDDSDYMQHFVADCDSYFVDTKESYLKGELFLCKELDSKYLMISPSAKEPPFDHKATKEELIERFKKKE